MPDAGIGRGSSVSRVAITPSIGRNDPCPCASGRKYKHCCLAAADALHLKWNQLRQAEGQLIPELLQRALDRWGKDGFEEAQRRFYDGFEPPDDPPSDAEFESLFLTWFGLRFAPGAADAVTEPASRRHLADARDLSHLEQAFLREASRRPVSFHHVTAVDAGRSIDLEDLLTGETCRVLERSASRTVRRGGVLYARTVTVDGVSIMVGCGSTVLPPSYRADIAAMRDSLAGRSRRLTAEQAAAHDDTLRRWYLSAAEQVHHPAPPELRNTDGDRIEPTTMYFELLCTPDEAFVALRSLNLVERDESALLADATRDASGNLQAFNLTWNKAGNKLHANWDNTSLGSIEVDGGALVASANSTRRAARLRKQIERRLDDCVVFQRTVTESIEAMLEQARREGITRASRNVTGAYRDGSRTRQAALGRMARLTRARAGRSNAARGGADRGRPRVARRAARRLRMARRRRGWRARRAFQSGAGSGHVTPRLRRLTKSTTEHPPPRPSPNARRTKTWPRETTGADRLTLTHRRWHRRRIAAVGLITFRDQPRDDQMGANSLKKLDYTNLQHTPDDGLRYEIINGALYVTPSPKPVHQRVSKRLQRQLEAYFESREAGEVFDAPVDVILDRHDIVVPDLVVVTDPAQITDRAIEGSPTLLVEILSPSTSVRDRTLKARRYAEKSVPHYWIVDARQRTIDCYRLRKKAYEHLLTAKDDAAVEHLDFPGLRIDLGALWR
jgi:Uma2 family endonuclease